MDHVLSDLSLADEPSDFAKELPYEEAVKLLRGRVPVTKKEWKDLEEKLRFRAFTIAKLSQYQAIDNVRQGLIKALEQGTGLAKFWDNLEQKEAGSPYYWETVYRTNIQTNYNAGRRMQIDKTDPSALQLIVIEDSRTSTICQPLAGLTLPANDAFWKTHWPPFHFNCRTTVRPIYNQAPKFSKMTRDQTSFKPQNSFGLDPLDSGNYWMMLPSMFEQGLMTGAITELNFMDNVISGYENKWKGYDRIEGNRGGWIDVPKEKPIDFDENKSVAEKLSNDGRRVKILPSFPRIEGWKNPDALIDGALFDFKNVASATRRGIQGRLDSAVKQHVRNVVLYIPERMESNEVKRGLQGWFGVSSTHINQIDKVVMIFGGRILDLTPKQILSNDFGF